MRKNEAGVRDLVHYNPYAVLLHHILWIKL